MEEGRRLAREAGFVHHLTKPMDLTKLDGLISKRSGWPAKAAIHGPGQAKGSGNRTTGCELVNSSGNIQDRPVCPGGRSVERPPDRFKGMDRDVDFTEDQGDRRRIQRALWVSLVARPLPGQWARSRVGCRAGSRRPVVRIVPDLDLVVMTAGYYQDYSPPGLRRPQQIKSGGGKRPRVVLARRSALVAAREPHAGLRADV